MSRYGGLMTSRGSVRLLVAMYPLAHEPEDAVVLPTRR